LTPYRFFGPKDRLFLNFTVEIRINPLNDEKMIEIKSTALSPEIIIDPKQLYIGLRGVCMPEIAASILSPVLQYAEEMLNTNGKVNLSFNLKYFNSASAHYLMRLFSRIAYLNHEEGVEIEWKFDADDEDNKEKGEFFAELSGLKFKFVKLT
jgi:hypothetical protein